MKAINNIKKRSIILCTALMLTGLSSEAQIFDNDLDVNDEAPAAPIDGLIGVGLAAGAYFGLRKKRKDQE